MDLNDNNNNDGDYDDNAFVGKYKDGNNEAAPVEANVSREEENSRLVCLLPVIIWTNENYSLSKMMTLLNFNGNAPDVFKAVELQAPIFFSPQSLICTGEFPAEDLPICFRCHWRNLMALFLRCNCNDWTGCRCYLYIQHTRCKDVGLVSIF
jgi:hypothetical protein